MSDTRRYPSIPPLTLAADLSSSEMTVKTANAVDWNGVALTTSLFNTDYIPGTLVNDARTKLEFVLIDASTLANLTTTGATLYKRGLPYTATGNDATDETEDDDRKLFWTQGETKLLIGTNPPWHYGQFPSRKNDEQITGAWTFAISAIPRLAAAGTWGAGTEEYFITKRYADALALSGAPDGSTTQKGVFEVPTDTEAKSFAAAGSGTTSADFALTPTNLKAFWDMVVTTDYTYGATITAGQFLRLDTADGKWKIADATSAANADDTYGVALDSGVNADTGKRVQIAGLVTGLVGLTVGRQYLSDTPGAIATTKGTYAKFVGFAPTTTTLLLVPSFRIEEIAGGNSSVTTAILNEMATFFANTDITAAEAETLTNGSDASAKHYHKQVVLTAQRAANAASGAQTIAHGLGVAPKYIQVDTVLASSNTSAGESSVGWSRGWGDGTISKCIYQGIDANGASPYKETAGASSTKIIYHPFADTNNNSATQEATASFDATNITLTWTLTGGGSLTNNIEILITAFA